MLTVLESIQLTTDYLEKKGIESPRFNAELMLAKILNKTRLELYLAFDRPLNESETTLYREYLKRRSMNEPLQYILGEVEFYGHKFTVDKSVLIPRPETEILVENIILGYPKEEELKILDIGTGSGIISISLAKHFNNCNVTAIDVSEEALSTAKKNAELNEVESRISFELNDICDEGLNYRDYDIVVSNPPYISLEEYGTLEPELTKYEPKIALTDQGDGYKFYKVISERAKRILKKNGKLFFEMGKDQHADISEIMLSNDYKNIEIKNDLQNIPRVISGELN